MQNLLFKPSTGRGAWIGQTLIVTSLLLAPWLANAAEYGTVVSSTPVVSQVQVPQQQCFDESQSMAPRNSGGGALAGAIIGGLIGNAVGGGSGRAATTGLGMIAGTVIGDRVEAQNQAPQVGMVRRCQTVNVLESRITAYDVVYDYAGRRYSARLAQNPGIPGTPLPLEVNVAPAGAWQGEGAAPQVGSSPEVIYYNTPPAPVYREPATTVYYSETVQPVYVAPPIYYRPPPRYIGGGTIFFNGGRHFDRGDRDHRRDEWRPRDGRPNPGAPGEARPIDGRPPGDGRPPVDGRRWRH